MKIKARLADSDDLFMSGKFFQLGNCLAGHVFRFVRMNSYRGVQVLESLGQLDAFSIVLRIGADGNPAGDVGGFASLQDVLDVPGQRLKRQMTMCIN